MPFAHEPLPGYELVRRDTDNGRFYVDPKDGLQFPSVTTILGRSLDNSWLHEWRKRVGSDEADRISSQARGRGSLIHDRIEKYLHNDPDWKKGLMPVNLVTLKTLTPLLDRHVDLVYATEHTLFSRRLRCAGTADTVARWKKRKAVLDYKTTRSSYHKNEGDILGYMLQVTCYAMMLYEQDGFRAERVVVLLTNGNEIAQVFDVAVDKYMGQVYDMFANRKW